MSNCTGRYSVNFRNFHVRTTKLANKRGMTTTIVRCCANSHFGLFMKGNKKDGGKRDGTFPSPKEAPYVAGARGITLSYLTSSPFPTLPSCLFRCRSAYWGAIVASPENTRRAWKRVRRSSLLNGEQKNLLSRSRDASPCILILYSQSALNPRRTGGWDPRDASTSRCSGERGSENPGIERFEESEPIYLFIYLFFFPSKTF